MGQVGKRDRAGTGQAGVAGLGQEDGLATGPSQAVTHHRAQTIGLRARQLAVSERDEQLAQQRTDPAVLLALAGAADSVSAVCRTTINQELTPERYRGRMSSFFSIVVTSGPRLGDLESGTVAAVAGVEFSVVSGGLMCVVGLAAIALAFPRLARYGTPAREPNVAAGGSATVAGR